MPITLIRYTLDDAPDWGVQFGARIAPHQVPEIHAHLCAAFPNTAFGVEISGPVGRDPLWDGLYRKRAEIRDSHVYLNEDPGWGTEIDLDFVAKCRA